MFEKLAEEHDLTLSLNVVPGCLWQEGLLQHQALRARASENCDDGPGRLVRRGLPELDPDVVVLMVRPRDDEAEWADEVVHRRDGVEQPLDRMTLQASRETLREDRAAGAPDRVVTTGS